MMLMVSVPYHTFTAASFSEESKDQKLAKAEWHGNNQWELSFVSSVYDTNLPPLDTSYSEAISFTGTDAWCHFVCPAQ